MNSNKVAWNPREPFNFVLANEDFNLYSFDMRNLDKALLIHKVFLTIRPEKYINLNNCEGIHFVGSCFRGNGCCVLAYWTRVC